MLKKQLAIICSKLPQCYIFIMTFSLVIFCTAINAYASDMWAVANTIIVDIYTQIAAISTVLAALMSAIAVMGAKLSNNQHKVDQAWDWLRRIWIAWVIINGIGAFVAYITPLFSSMPGIDGK